MKQFIVPVKVTATRVADMLVGAFEGGSNYWARINWNRSIEPEEIDFEQFKDDREFCGYDEVKSDGQHVVYAHVHIPMSPGGSLAIYDAEDSKNFLGTLSLVEIEKGLILMAEKYPSHFGDMIAENDDATTADVLVQLSVLGEIVYG